MACEHFKYLAISIPTAEVGRKESSPAPCDLVTQALITQPGSVGAPGRSPEDFKRNKTSPIKNSLFHLKHRKGRSLIRQPCRRKITDWVKETMTKELIFFCLVNLDEGEVTVLFSFKGSLLNKRKSRKKRERGQRRERGRKWKLLGAIIQPKARILH